MRLSGRQSAPAAATRCTFRRVSVLDGVSAAGAVEGPRRWDLWGLIEKWRRRHFSCPQWWRRRHFLPWSDHGDFLDVEKVGDTDEEEFRTAVRNSCRWSPAKVRNALRTSPVPSPGAKSGQRVGHFFGSRRGYRLRGILPLFCYKRRCSLPCAIGVAMVQQSPELGLMQAMVRQAVGDVAGGDVDARAEALAWLAGLDPALLDWMAPGVKGEALREMLLRRAENPRLAKRLARVLSDEPPPKPKAGMAKLAAPAARAPMVRVLCSVCGREAMHDPCFLCA